MASRGRPLPQYVIDQIRRLRRSGKSVRQIADLAGVAKSTVEIYVSEAGPSSAPNGRPFRPKRSVEAIPSDFEEFDDFAEDLTGPFDF